jgi:Leucine-rich repeat (LRR) protein
MMQNMFGVRLTSRLAAVILAGGCLVSATAARGLCLEPSIGIDEKAAQLTADDAGIRIAPELLRSLAKLGAKIRPIKDNRTVAVDLSVSNATDDDLAKLAGISTLSLLKLPARITDAGLKHIEPLSGLRQLYLYDAKVTDAGLLNLAKLTELKQLHLNGTSIGDGGLAHLKALKSLEVLNLTNTKASDAGLKSLKDLKALKKLSIRGTAITIAGVVQLYVTEQKRSLVDALDALDAVTRGEDGQVTAIDVGGTQFGDAELARLKPIPSLRQLHLANSQITDAGMIQLKGQTGLEGLYLARCNIGDAGLAHIKGLKHLRALNLYGTKITSAGIAHLMGLKQLKALYITDLKLSTAAVEKLKKALPNLTVTDFTAQ